MSDNEISDTESVKARRVTKKARTAAPSAKAASAPKAVRQPSKAASVASDNDSNAASPKLKPKQRSQLPLPEATADDDEIAYNEHAEHEAMVDALFDEPPASAAAAAASSSPAAYNGFASQSSRPLKRKAESVAADESDHEAAEEEQDGGASAAAADDSNADEGLIMIRNPPKVIAKASLIPADTNFSNPNNTLRYFSIKNSLNVHYSELNPAKHFMIHESKPKAGFTRSFFSVNCLKAQKFDFTGNTNFRPTMFGQATVIGAFGVTRYPRMYPYGDRDALPNSKFPAPDDVSKIKFKIPVTNHDYASVLAMEKNNVGLVDGDADTWQSRWVRMGFDKWAPQAAWKVSTTAFPLRRKELEAEIVNQFKYAESVYSSELESWNASKKKGTKPLKPDTSDAKKEEALRRQFFINGIKGSVGSSENHKYEHVNVTAPVLKMQTKKDRDAGREPQLPNDPWFVTQYKNPPLWEDKSKKEMKPGFPKIPNDVPMFRCVTADEAEALHASGRSIASPIRLIPRENRFIVTDDVVAPIYTIDKFDSKMGSGFRFILVGVVWLGERGRLNEMRQPVAGVDPTTYFVMAQKYERTKANFNPNNVENSSGYSNGNNNPSAANNFADEYGNDEDQE